MTDQAPGRLETVPLRNVWQDEAKDFTPWLARHLDLLGTALNLELTLLDEEAAVGPFSADIVAEAAGVGQVVIENQLTLTDHRHLGQLLTYAAGKRASVLIWVAQRFQDEHRAALELLDDWSPEGTLIFGVEVRVVRIGDSLPAPEFRPLVFPNEWIRESRRTSQASPDANRYREFWRPLRAQMTGEGIPPNTRRGDASSQSFRSAIGTNGILYYLTFKGDSQAEVQFSVDTDNITQNKDIFDELFQKREEIEQTVGTTLQWDRRDENRASIIRATHSGSLDDPPSRQDEIREWMIEVLMLLKGAIDPLLLAHQSSLDTEEAVGVEGGLGGDDFE